MDISISGGLIIKHFNGRLTGASPEIFPHLDITYPRVKQHKDVENPWVSHPDNDLISTFMDGVSSMFLYVYRRATTVIPRFLEGEPPCGLRSLGFNQPPKGQPLLNSTEISQTYGEK